MLWLWLFISGLILVIILLLIKIHLLRKSAKEIECSFSEKLITDSNTLIDISSNDKYMCHLANEINIQLQFNRVVFPEPLAPMIATNSPLSTYIEIPSTAFVIFPELPP